MKGVCEGGDVISVMVTWTTEKGKIWFPSHPSAQTQMYTYIHVYKTCQLD